MKICFAAVGETSAKYLNMIKLLLYSFRKNAGIYKDALFTVVTNGTSMPEKDISIMRSRFSPIHIVTMPPLGGTPHNNKFNAFYAVDESTYDILVLLDCDTVVLGDLDEITRSVPSDQPYFKAIATGSKTTNRLIGYDSLIKHYANLTDKELQMYKTNKFVGEGYPLFNSGVLVLTKESILTIRNDIIRISYDLYNRAIPIPFSPKKYISNRYSQLISKIFQNHRSIKNYLGSTYYPLWFTEQIALAIALIKHRIPFEILDTKFNCWGQMPDNSLPRIFHYLKGAYKLDRDNLFKGNWIEEYLNSNLVKKSLANLVKSYNLEIGI